MVPWGPGVRGGVWDWPDVNQMRSSGLTTLTPLGYAPGEIVACRQSWTDSCTSAISSAQSASYLRCGEQRKIKAASGDGHFAKYVV